MGHFLSALLVGRLKTTLVASFSLVAALTVGLNALVIARVIQSYLGDAMAERVARDMDLARAFCQVEQDAIVAVAHRTGQDPGVIRHVSPALLGQSEAIGILEQEVSRKITVPTLRGTHLIAVLGTDGRILVGKVLSPEGELLSVTREGNWGQLPIVEEVLSSGSGQTGTEVIPAAFLAQVGLDDQAIVSLIPTDRAAPEPFDPREGTAGLAMVAVYPLRGENDQMIGMVVVAYLMNNDFNLVDRVKEVAGVDTVTIFFGDLRVSTNVMTEEGERAVGTRVSQEVREVVLEQGSSYVGRAYVVNDWYITRYEPLLDHMDRVVGSLYVGARESAFLGLVHTFNSRVALIALVCIVVAGVIAVPIAQLITSPIAELVDANHRLAEGDMVVRVPVRGDGELAGLGRSFNSMVETLYTTQQQLVQNEKLALMGQLAAGVAHEINNPLGTILLFADVMHKEASETDPLRDDLKMIIGEATRCKSIVADLLNFARQNKLAAEEVNIRDLLDKVLESVQHQPSFRGVDIRRRIDPDMPTFEADPVQLQQVFTNLLSNAAESIEESGAITLAAHGVEGQQMEITISDTGCGIPEENLGRLFTPFFTTKADKKGTGLGLSIVYGIVKMHRGQISVESQVGQGTAFIVSLPLRSPARQLGQLRATGDVIS